MPSRNDTEPDPTSDAASSGQNRPERDFADAIQAKEARKQRSRKRGRRGILFGMGMFGVVGWSVALPTLVCLALGVWIDAHYDTRFSWTLMLLAVGIALGSLTAWHWVREESQRP